MTKYMKGFVKSYIATALWSSTFTLTDSNGEEQESYELDRMVDNGKATLSFSMIKKCILDCDKFIDLVDKNFMSEDAEYILTRTGSDLDYLAPHDFWLTRNYHGSGFWERFDWDDEDHGNLGEKLTEICHNDFKEVDLYVGDDGRIYYN